MDQDPIQNYAQRVQTFRARYREFNAKPRGPIASAFHLFLTLVVLLLLLVLIIPLFALLLVVGLCLFAYFRIRRAFTGPRTPDSASAPGRENVRVIRRD